MAKAITISHECDAVTKDLFFSFCPFDKAAFRFATKFCTNASTVLGIDNAAPIPRTLTSCSGKIVRVCKLTVPASEGKVVRTGLERSPMEPCINVNVNHTFDHEIGIATSFKTVCGKEGNVAVRKPSNGSIRITC